jgi:hypothetical protein
MEGIFLAVPSLSRLSTPIRHSPQGWCIPLQYAMALSINCGGVRTPEREMGETLDEETMRALKHGIPPLSRQSTMTISGRSTV